MINMYSCKFLLDSGKYQGLFGLTMGILDHLRSRQTTKHGSTKLSLIFLNRAKTCMITWETCKNTSFVGIWRLKGTLFSALSTPAMQFISVYILLTLSIHNKWFGNENKANDHIQQFIYDEKRISRDLFTRTLRRQFRRIRQYIKWRSW